MESLILEMSQDLISWALFTPSFGSITLTFVGDLEKLTLRMSGFSENAYIRLRLNVLD